MRRLAQTNVWKTSADDRVTFVIADDAYSVHSQPVSNIQTGRAPVLGQNRADIRLPYCRRRTCHNVVFGRTSVGHSAEFVTAAVVAVAAVGTPIDRPIFVPILVEHRSPTDRSR